MPGVHTRAPSNTSLTQPRLPLLEETHYRLHLKGPSTTALGHFLGGKFYGLKRKYLKFKEEKSEVVNDVNKVSKPVSMSHKVCSRCGPPGDFVVCSQHVTRPHVDIIHGISVTFYYSETMRNSKDKKKSAFIVLT